MACTIALLNPHPTPMPLMTSANRGLSNCASSDQTYRHISQSLGIGHSSVVRILQRKGQNLLANLEPAAPVQRYEHEKLGYLLHLDIKKLGRFPRSRPSSNR